ncbi:MAG: hypothetical protein ACEPOW_13395, partial [Bacteroidales bacterium]
KNTPSKHITNSNSSLLDNKTDCNQCSIKNLIIEKKETQLKNAQETIDALRKVVHLLSGNQI